MFRELVFETELAFGPEKSTVAFCGSKISSTKQPNKKILSPPIACRCLFLFLRGELLGQLHKRRQQINWKREQDRRIVLRRDLPERLQIAELQRLWLLADDLCGVHEFLGRLELTFRVDDLRAPFALDSIKRGEMNACSTYSPIDAGTIGMRAAAKILHGEKVPKDIPLYGTIIDKTNVNKYYSADMTYVSTVDLKSTALPTTKPGD